MMFRTSLLVILISAFGFACGDDSTGGGTPDSSGGGTPDSRPGGIDSSGGGIDSGNGGIDSSGGEAAAFCATYQTKCGYGTTMHYASQDACVTYYNDASDPCLTCITTHLGLAPTDDMGSVHCTHAAGFDTCDPSCP